MSDLVRWILIIILILVLLWLIYQFLVDWAKDKKIVQKSGSRSAAAPATSLAATTPVAQANAKVMDDAPKASSKPDDLTKVEGIGPKIAGLLNDDGIMTFSELADASTERLQGILHDAGARYQIHDPTSWPEQAGLAAAGEWDALESLQDRLDGGR